MDSNNYLKKITSNNLKKILKKKGLFDNKKKKIDIVSDLILKKKITIETIFFENILLDIEKNILKNKKTEKIIVLRFKENNNDSEKRYFIQNIFVMKNKINFKGYLIKNDIREINEIIISIGISQLYGYYLLLDKLKEKNILYIEFYLYDKIPEYFKFLNKKLTLDRSVIINNIYDNIKIKNNNLKKKVLRIYNNNKINFIKDIIIKEITLYPEDCELAFNIMDSYLTKKKNIHFINIITFTPEKLIGKYILNIKDDILYINIFEYFPSLDNYNINPINGELIDKNISKYF